MGKMNEFSLCVSELRNAAQSLNAVADSLTALFSNDGGTAEATTPKTEPKPVTLEEVRAVLAEKSRAGHTAEVRGLLEKHGAAKLSLIDPSEYAALLVDAEGLIK
jgi:hypothetical protein